MNEILVLKGQFQRRENKSGYGLVNLPKNSIVTVEHIEKLKKQLQKLKLFWEKDNTIKGALVSVHYNRVVAKSNRLQRLLSDGGHPSLSIRGAKFNKQKKDEYLKHIFTYFVSLSAIDKSINLLDKAEKVLNAFFDGKIENDDMQSINAGQYQDDIIPKSTFLRVILDVNYVEKFSLDTVPDLIENESVVTLYRTGVSSKELLKQFGIDLSINKIINDTTFLLDKHDMRLLQHNAPYLIAMKVENFTDIPVYESEHGKQDIIEIPEPGNEPIVGVIDTFFYENVYFKKWVNFKNINDYELNITAKDCAHGTAVTSIIVDGPTLNPKYDDGCGRFQVRHFGVCPANGFKSHIIIRQIEAIVEKNRDIKVWNLSLGSNREIDSNFISPEAAELDKLQSEYDVVFVIAGTNKNQNNKNSIKIGSPADSINGIVVNSVNNDGDAASYSRTGPVLSFFYKPDVSCFGGDKADLVRVCEPMGEAFHAGTSFAAPWVTRKMAYLIHVVGLSREVAKALLIDSAAAWNRKDNTQFKIGYGVIPTDIKDVLHSDDDEIKFMLSGSIEEYETYTYSLPIPQDKNTHPFYAKATLAYFPTCDRNQGVDYTSTELDLHFGRVVEKVDEKGKKNVSIKPINHNKQADEGIQNILEEDARNFYRKWDNVKHICEALKSRPRPKKVYEAGMWGISIKTKERLIPKTGRGLSFGVVVTLKEMYGVNRIDEFIKACQLKGWLVHSLDVQTRVDVHNQANEDIKLE